MKDTDKEKINLELGKERKNPNHQDMTFGTFMHRNNIRD